MFFSRKTNLPPPQQHWQQILNGDTPVAELRPGFSARQALAAGASAYLMSHHPINIRAISGTSGGGLCAAVVADALCRHQSRRRRNTAAAKAQLDLWREDIAISDFMYPHITAFLGHFEIPQEYNPLLKLAGRRINFSRLRGQSRIQVFTASERTSDKTGFVFETAELTPELVAASAALPGIFAPIRLKNPQTNSWESHIDGGDAYNPSIMRLVENGQRSFILYDIIPEPGALAAGTPVALADMAVRFRAPLLRELGALRQWNTAHAHDHARVFVLNLNTPHSPLAQANNISSSNINTMLTHGAAVAKHFTQHPPTVIE